ncbi:deoxyribonuclease V [Aquisalimonas sp.]|uniref:deoxyribonuclease V n=1 Tax=Aquisalimonas sp. TaxID=1872621 RepID=UPI0025BB5706|nr:deoxyribonuclease V [Aquisalimonas sp.]
MVTAALHEWPGDVRSARGLQQALAGRVRLDDATGRVTTVAGVDTGFEAGGHTARACVARFRWPDLTPLETVIGRAPVTFPYIPGYLSFREMPAILDAMVRLEQLPDLLLCDGQGIAHPRRLGIASHLGLWLDRPAIGVGKSRLCGSHEEVGEQRGDQQPLMDGDTRIGTVLRTRSRVKPVFVSPGHRVSHDGAVAWVMATLSRYRLPEPIRAADREASRRR